MKRQRNNQQVKEHEKGPPNLTKEEEIGNLPEKEFRIMIMKMIQNLESKMESQINSLETISTYGIFSINSCPSSSSSNLLKIDKGIFELSIAKTTSSGETLNSFARKSIDGETLFML